MSTPTTRVNVVCAPPNGPNPGMASVDLAFEHVARHAGLTDVRYWRLWDQSEWRAAPGGSERLDDHRVRDTDTGLTYELARGRLEEVLDADRVVFWGDFLHMAVYLEHSAHVLTDRIGLPLDADAALRLTGQHLLLTDAGPDVLGRVVTYGSTLAFNMPGDYRGPYGEALRRFHRGAAAVSHRDPYSSEVAQRHRGGADCCGGTDAALVLPPPCPATHTDSAVGVGGDPRGTGGAGDPGVLGVFVGRSRLSPEDVGTFGRRLAGALGLRSAWVPWGHEPGFWPMRGRARLRLAWPELDAGVPTASGLRRARLAASALREGPRPDEPLTLGQLEHRLLACRLVLTDTYHLALTAWRLGVPAVCLVDPPHAEWSVNAGAVGSERDKRVDLYSRLDALPLLVHALPGRLRSRAEVRRVADALADGHAEAAARSWVSDRRSAETARVLRMLALP
ncbi:hypothetical protein [Intrasporangium flavum]|uniref:hypothetical protein n=1 Tax=Intrasporangium flavum TaxID=1428657 RepID=UPI00096C0FF4|nr:hypothetical protein [Intrasporangium flavum]